MKWRIEFEEIPSIPALKRPPGEVRMRRLLKLALRYFGFRAVEISDADVHQFETRPGPIDGLEDK